MFDKFQIFLSGAFLGAAALGMIGSILSAPLSASLALPAMVAARVGSAVEVVGSLLLGLVAVAWVRRAKR